MSRPDNRDASDPTLPDDAETFSQPDIDICPSCGEHAQWDDHGSNCCGSRPYDTDPDLDMER